jgi:hypothetical protein
MPDVYEEGSDERDFIEKSVKAGVPIGQVELIMVLSKQLDKKSLEIQNQWLDAHVGIQQVIRSFA